MVRLIDKVFHTAFSDSEPLESQINDLLANIWKINELKANTFDDEIMAIAIINALPASLDTLQTILGNATALVSADVKSQIIEDEQRRIGRSGSDATTFFAKARSDARKGKQPKHKTDQGDKPKGKLHCSHCDIAGHDVAECRKLKHEKAKASDATPKASDGVPKEASKASVKVAVVDDDTDDSSDSSDSSAQSPPKLHILRVTHRALTDKELGHAWIVDSGASRTMMPNRNWFTQFSPLSTPIVIALGDNSVIRGTGVGRVTVELQVHGTWQPVILQDVLYVPELHGNLLSVAQLTRRGYDVCFSKDGCKLLDSASTIACEGSRYTNLYTLPIRVNPPDSAHVATTQVDSFPSEGEDAPVVHALTACGTFKADVNTWHHRLAHLDHDAVMRMMKRGMVRGMEIVGGSSKAAPCEPCLKGKQTRSEILKHTETRSDTVLGRVFSDVCRKLPTRSHVGYEYFATFVDDKSRKVFVVGLKHKSDVAKNLKDFIAHAETQTGERVKILRSDGGGEYIGNVLTDYLKEKGIKQELTTPDTLQHNSVAEQMNRTLLDKVRAMLTDADLPEVYWFEALVYAAHLHNVSPTRALDDATPEEAWSRNKPNVSHLRVFGSKAFVHVPAAQRDKLGAKSLLCTFLGHAENRKAFRLVHRPTRHFLESRNVIFDEGEQDYQHVTLERYTSRDQTRTDASPAAPVPALPTIMPPSPTVSDMATVSSRPKRSTRTPTWDDDQHYSVSSYRLQQRLSEHACIAKANIAGDLRSYVEAMARPDAAEWELACDNKKRAFEHLGVYEIVPRPIDRKVVGSKWVFHIKRGPDGSIQKYKACIVAQGFTQIEGIDYDKTFVPVTKLASLRAILAIAAERDLELHQMDVKSAYLNGSLTNEIFMAPPPGLNVPEGMVLRLIKAVYGTKQGGHVWYEEISGTLGSMGYTRTDADHAVFTCGVGSTLSIIALYVDDITMVASNLETINQDKWALTRVYEMTDLGELSWILGMHVVHDRQAGWISLSQEKYSLEVLNRFNKSDVRPISTPTLANEHLLKLNEAQIDAKHYQSALGALMYPMIGSRPVLAYTVATLGRHAARPGTAHQHALDRAFRYLHATSNLCLVYRCGALHGTTLCGFVDVDWASDINDRKSTSGFVFILAGAAISWSSKKQPVIALSSTEAEYIAAAHAVKEAVWLRRLLTELGLDLTDPTTLHVNNQSAIVIARNPEFHDRTKHIEVQHHFLRQLVDEGHISPTYLPTGDQIADVLTKGLSCEKHEKFSMDMGLAT